MPADPRKAGNDSRYLFRSTIRLPDDDASTTRTSRARTLCTRLNFHQEPMSKRLCWLAMALLGIDSYSIRAYRWKALELIDYASRQGAQALQISLNDLESTDSAYLEKVKQAAQSTGLYLDAAAGCFGQHG